jgi:hypothetical protein
MKLFEIDQETKLPKASAEARMIKSFNDLLKRLNKVEGDSDGRRKLRNEQELAYVYYQGVYDSRFKLIRTEEDRNKAIKTLIGLPDDWQPDQLVKKCIEDFKETQFTESLPLVENIQKSILSLNNFIVTAQGHLSTAGLESGRAVTEFLDILDRIPKTIDNLNKAKETLRKEQDALAKGRKGRALNKFEEDD